MPKGHEPGIKKEMHDGEMTTFCYCNTDLCNQDLETCLKSAEGTGPNDTITTEGTSKKDQSPTPARTKDDQNSTDDSAAATGENNQQTTRDAAEHAATTVQAAATGGNKRVVESNQFAFVLCILVTLIMKSL